MNLLVSGASGFVGAALSRFLTEKGHRVVPLSRRAKTGSEPSAVWDPAAGMIDLSRAGPLHAAIHLAGENLAQRWTAAKKASIYHSRVKGTELLSRALAALAERPATLICASGVGYYGDRGDEILDESSSLGRGFLAEVCRDWEAAAEAAREAKLRVVHLRFGLVLGPRGGALGKMLPVFRLGLGGRLGSGQQWWSWISLDDVLQTIAWVLSDERCAGPVNATSPHPVRNSEFTKTLGAVLRRPTLFAVPALAARFVFGEMADEALLASTRVRPARLEKLGFTFRHSTLDVALRECCSRP